MAITEHSNRSLFKPSDLEKQRQVLLADTIEVQKHIPAGILPPNNSGYFPKSNRVEIEAARTSKDKRP